MNLTLEVISANGSNLGVSRRKVFGSDGGSIGRGEQCTWRLPSPERYVSRHHATIDCRGGQFYVKPEGDNPVGLNAVDALLPQGRPAAVKSGDRLFIDEYEILVSVASEARSLILGDPFAEEADGGMLAPLDEPVYAEDLDPLRGIPAPADTGSSGRHYLGVPEGDVLSEPVTLPPIGADFLTPLAEPASGASRLSESAEAPRVAIPADWNKTTYGNTESAEPAPSLAGRPPIAAGVPVTSPRSGAPAGSRSAPAAAPRGLGAVGGLATGGGGGAAAALKIPDPAARSRPALRPGRPASPAVPPAQTAALPRGQRPAPSAARPVPMPASAPARSRPPEAATAARAPAASGPRPAFDLDAVMRAAGVDPQTVPEDLAETFGRILLVVVQGTIDALRAREEIKSQFRLAVTRVRDSNNNPLTFALDANEALATLLGRRNAAYLAPVEAFQRAFDDIRNHQVAMLAGMRAGFESLLEGFDPEQLQEDFDKRGKGGVLGMGKPKYWDLYVEHFKDLRGDTELAFRRLFGDEFGRAYEQQIEQIKQRGKS
ncbi:MAG TPA: type VI secretion system-associated FHA domain protein TagH [Steroidobacteraceae bacterium]|nr:type VI secretion system-associated FHA domain protein TagH [Steroidobacteraceae bacterium]